MNFQSRRQGQNRESDPVSLVIEDLRNFDKKELTNPSRRIPQKICP